MIQHEKADVVSNVLRPANQDGSLDSAAHNDGSPNYVLIPTILCGGAGSRLWPVSREMHPKPFIRLADGQSLLQKAFLRGAGLTGAAEILTVTNRELFFKTEDEFKAVNKAGIATLCLLEVLPIVHDAPVIAFREQVVAEIGVFENPDGIQESAVATGHAYRKQEQVAQVVA